MSEKNIENNAHLQSKLQKALAECSRLKEENARLRTLLGLPGEEAKAHTAQKASITNDSSPEVKVGLFRSLFRGREDVYPIRWEGKDGKSGYSPACANEWNRPLCNKPKVKCADCANRELLPLIDKVIFEHLAGKHIVGVYPLQVDETCWFLAADFDKNTWQEDVAAVLETCREMGVPAALERSRSGNGGHIWIFFDQPVPAALARKLGFAILTRTMERRHLIGLDSYDRFFPNQDTMPKGGFGNLIALPLQLNSRAKGNSLFLDRNFQPYKDQWAYLATVEKINFEKMQSIIWEASVKGDIIGVRKSVADEARDEDPWTILPSGRKPDELIPGAMPTKVGIIYSNMVFIEKDGLPPAMINRLMRIAAFQNPDFYKTQAMRLPTFGKPIVIDCAQDFSRHIGLPRGCLEEALELLHAHNIETVVTDERVTGIPLDATFNGKMRDSQLSACKELLADDTGILSATTAFGKTVVAAWMISARKVNTLVLVHRKQLMDQWKERLTAFLDIPVKSIGQIGGGKDKRTGVIDIGIIQSLSRKGAVKDLVTEYGQIIVDECHHLSAFSFEQVLKQAKAKYILGLTATPTRKDGHHPIVMMQCGPIRFRVNAKKQAKERPFEHNVIPRYTNFMIPPGASSPGIQDIYAALAADEGRNDLIFDDILKALEAGRSPILLTERTGHVEYFAKRLKKFARNVIVLRGGMGKKQRKALAEQIAGIPDGEERVLIATGRYIGEGFDDARLDTLFLVMPISWRGTLQQYAGRLHRLHDSKQVVQIYDYIDVNLPMLSRMYEKRLKGYRAMGYKVKPGN